MKVPFAQLLRKIHPPVPSLTLVHSPATRNPTETLFLVPSPELPSVRAAKKTTSDEHGR